MLKKVLIIFLFLLLFAGAAKLMFYWQDKPRNNQQAEQNISANLEAKKFDDAATYHYRAEELSDSCQADDALFCAVELTVKCILNPQFLLCDKAMVPAFVVGQTDDVERPTEISFKITKIKPVPESSDVSVFTESDCNALWFGLCKGTVVYNLTPMGEKWKVNNIFALD